MSKKVLKNQQTGSQFYKPDTQASKAKFDLFSFRIPAGFPSPAEDFKENTLDLNDYLIKNKSATFLVKVTGTSMEGAGIFEGDLLVIDRAAEIVDGKIILGVLNGEFTVKKLKLENQKVILYAENENFKPIEISDETDFKIWGVVTFCLHRL